MTTIDALKIAKTLIDKPEHWCQGAYARDVNGRTCNILSPDAYSFCSAGALWRTVQGALPVHYSAMNLLEKAMKESPGGFNDYNDHHTVMKAWGKAIELAESERITP